jgi:hypothetical protein
VVGERVQEVGAVELLQSPGVMVLTDRRAQACLECHGVESHDDLLVVVVAWSYVQ